MNPTDDNERRMRYARLMRERVEDQNVADATVEAHERRREKPLKKARSEAEITRTRQGWVLIGLAVLQIVLVWLTRH